MKVLLLTILLMGCSSIYKDNRSHSKHFREGVFHNTTGHSKSLWMFFKMRMTTDWSSWSKWVETPQSKDVIARNASDDFKVTYINHSTFLIQSKNINILTDPIFSKRCSPVQFAGPKRVHRAGVKQENIPKIDVVLISHDHYDHLDMNSINYFIDRDNPKIYVGLGVGKRLKKRANVVEMDWWESSVFNENLKVYFTQVQHFSGRSLTDRDTTLWGGFVLDFGHRKIYFGGDSGYAGHYKENYKRYGKMDLSFIPIGCYAPRDFMSYAHLDPEQAVMAHMDLVSKKSIGMHYGTFQLTSEAREEPLILLEKYKKEYDVVDDAFVTLELGKTYTFY